MFTQWYSSATPALASGLEVDGRPGPAEGLRVEELAVEGLEVRERDPRASPGPAPAGVEWVEGMEVEWALGVMGVDAEGVEEGPGVSSGPAGPWPGPAGRAGPVLVCGRSARDGRAVRTTEEVCLSPRKQPLSLH